MASGSSSGTSLSDVVKAYIDSNKVMVFSRSQCPYSLKAKELLKQQNIIFSSMELDEMPNGRLIQEELLSLTGHWTVPNIFIKGEHIGGFDDLRAFMKSGKMSSDFSSP